MPSSSMCGTSSLYLATRYWTMSSCEVLRTSFSESELDLIAEGAFVVADYCVQVKLVKQQVIHGPSPCGRIGRDSSSRAAPCPQQCQPPCSSVAAGVAVGKRHIHFPSRDRDSPPPNVTNFPGVENRNASTGTSGVRISWSPPLGTHHRWQRDVDFQRSHSGNVKLNQWSETKVCRTTPRSTRRL